ncbi:TraR/DksA family transcriptional regulator [Agromyces marinus]|uniref:DnaK suppressor protein n=1 Tax=Agromyces marinus TaxID=1389020 RepID=A0ABN6Y9B8_9MICO|nr:TraR/DksA C4-type zinc finger protein [Agromyces marinus]UIP57890.1 RNA polymerase-binding transcription factor DksA [Agromyces marinus]BDZ53914.1 DnaK suppressor protein [Agromyces marinus]
MTGVRTAEQLERFRQLLLAERREAEERLATQSESITAVREARSEVSVDDEHDPDGPTMSQEWSQRTAVLHDVEHELDDIDRALARIDDGTYGICERCGSKITVARLEARPTATLCIDCARLVR